jgi:hypothetical protein
MIVGQQDTVARLLHKVIGLMRFSPEAGGIKFSKNKFDFYHKLGFP